MYVNRTSNKREPIIGLVLNGVHRKQSSESMYYYIYIYIYIYLGSNYKYI